MTVALEFIKVLSLRPVSCATASINMNFEYDDRKINLDDIEDLAEDDAISRAYFCAISDAASTLLTSNLSFLTENRTYVYEAHRLELLPPHELYTFDR
uniref:Uncharacterized protein n=1 Tax=Romanomermis culicivorax TaxID=13658 RepID=A0A915I107_ROMCU